MNSLSDNEKKAAMKEKFESLLNKRDVKENSSLLTREKLLSLIADVKKSKTSDKKVPRDYWLLQHYDVLEVQGVEKLIVPVTNATPDVMFYCSSDSLFDILYETHLSIGHGGRDRMIKELNRRYKNITQNDIKIFLNFCESCQQKRKAGRKGVVVKPMIFSHMNSRCQVDLIDFQSQPDGNYKFILVYQDHLTKFLVLRPLQTKRAEEVAGQLLDIFLLFGAPCILQSDNGREFCNKLIDDLKVTWPELKIVHGKPRHSQSQGSVERANQDIENMLTTWMQDNQSTSWSNGLKFIQFMKNRAFHSGIKRSPYEAMFGCAARVGLSTTAIPKEALNSLVDEDQLQNTLTAMNVSSQPDNEKVVEQTVLNNPITKVCVVCLKECSEDIVCFKCMEPVHISCSEDYVSEDEVEQKICKLCFNELNVQREREKSKKCLEIQAKKMKLMSDKSHSEASVGFTVRIPVPEVDRGKGDAKSILAIIIKITEEGFFQLGTRNGRIKQLYSRSQFSVCEQKLIKIEEVPDVEISLRSVATAQSLGTGQGFKKCSCKTQCVNKKCFCFRNNVLCNSKCHFSNPCCNK